MAKKTLLSRLHQPVHPILAAVLIGLVLIGGITALVLRSYQYPALTANPTPNGTTQTTYTCFPLTPTPTLAPGQKAIYTFYVQSNMRKNGFRGIDLKKTDTGKIINIYTNKSLLRLYDDLLIKSTMLSSIHITTSSPQNIFEQAFTGDTPGHIIGGSFVVRSGCGIVTLTQTVRPYPPPTFTSNNLGISFSYLTDINGTQKFFTKEIGNTVYLYWIPGTNQPFSGSDAEFLKTIGGFSVEVFNKDPKLSLTDAIRQRFLTGRSEADCSIVYPYRNGYPREDMSYQTAAIEIFRSPTDTLTQLDAKLAKCPAGYTESGRGILYFMMDPKHPNKLLFVRVGQDNIPSGVGGLTWDGTIKVLQ